jgi:hypothetical protein
LLAELTKRGCFGRTVYQLEDWRLAGWLPQPDRRWLGHGRGSTSRYPAEAVPIAIALASNIRPGYPTEKVVLELFLKGFPFSEKAVRGALMSWLDRAERRLKKLRQGGKGAITTADARVRAGISVYDPLLLVFNPDHKQLENRANRRRDLKDAASIDLGLAFHDELPAADIVIAWLKLMGMPDTAKVNTQNLRDKDDPSNPQVRLSTLIRRRVKSAPFSQILAARTVVMMWGWILFFVILGASYGDETAEQLLTTLQNDEGALWFVQFIGLALTKPRKVAAILWLTGSGDDYIDMGLRYAKVAWPVACEIVANTHRAHSDDFEEQAMAADYIEALAYVGQLDPYEFGDLPIEERPIDLEWLETMAITELSRFQSRMNQTR